MKNWTIALGLLMCTLVLPKIGYSSVISYSVAEIDALLIDDVIGGFSVANLIQGNNLDDMIGVGRSLAGGANWDFPNDVTRRQAGSGADNRWIQTDNDEVWDLGFASSRIVVGNSYDHDRFTADVATKYLEAMEFTAWGSNDSGAAFGGQFAPGIWELATIGAVYEQGFTAAETWDDFIPVLNFTQSYRYVHVIAQGSIDINELESNDNEINFIGGFRTDVPEPATLALFGLGVMGIGIRRRRRTKV